LDGNQLAGTKRRTSEILMHLQIMKRQPAAVAVVHCHPPHATAYAITGRVPPNQIISEFELIVGKVAIAPYETPGTKAFAETVVPYVKQHNTVLLANHGIVCWSDTVTHAEWSVEVLETYCSTLMLAAQLGAPISRISEEHASDLHALKKKLGLPDIGSGAPDRMDCQPSDLEVSSSMANSSSVSPPTLREGSSGYGSGADLELLVKSVTDAVMEALEAGTKGLRD
jgi:L-fuculose-phosphate aldolase